MAFSYGPAPVPSGDWLDVPQDWFAVYVQMLPRLQAEEDLAWVYRYQIAAGLRDENEQKQYVAGLKQTAQISQRRHRQSEAEVLANFATIGIPISNE